MKKLIAVMAVAAFAVACNNNGTTTGATSDSTKTDSLAQNPDTSKKIINQVNDVLDSAAKKMDTAANKLKEASDKMKK